MGIVFQRQGKDDQALEFYEKDLKITKRVLGIVFFLFVLIWSEQKKFQTKLKLS